MLSLLMKHSTGEYGLWPHKDRAAIKPSQRNGEKRLRGWPKWLTSSMSMRGKWNREYQKCTIWRRMLAILRWKVSVLAGLQCRDCAYCSRDIEAMD
ncbi:hypothetical protein AAF712_016238, partial [Marasmius tenuissimus]